MKAQETCNRKLDHAPSPTNKCSQKEHDKRKPFLDVYVENSSEATNTIVRFYDQYIAYGTHARICPFFGSKKSKKKTSWNDGGGYHPV